MTAAVGAHPSATIEFPHAWTMATARADRLADLHRRIAATQMRSTVIAAELVALGTATDLEERERQFWATFDDLARYRLDLWVLSSMGQMAPPGA